MSPTLPYKKFTSRTMLTIYLLAALTLVSFAVTGVLLAERFKSTNKHRAAAATVAADQTDAIRTLLCFFLANPPPYAKHLTQADRDARVDVYTRALATIHAKPCPRDTKRGG